MNIILLERVAKLGQMGEVVRVKNGYARNFLLPRGKALRATEANKKHFEGQRAQLETRNLERKGEAEAIGEKLNGQVFTIIRQAGEFGPALWFGLDPRHRRGGHSRWFLGRAQSGHPAYPDQGARPAQGAGASASGSGRRNRRQHRSFR